MSGSERWAVIPTRGDREATLGLCLEVIARQVDGVVVVDNSDHGMIASTSDVEVLSRAMGGTKLAGIHDPQQPPNLSQLWNRGIDLAVDFGARWVAVVNDDAFVSPGWFQEVTDAMQRHGCAAGSYGGGRFVVHTKPGTTALDQRLCGWAFILDARYRLRADEQFQWWCGDNDLDMQARDAGGTVILGGDPVRHLYPDRSTQQNPHLAARTGEDMRLFVQKWGFRPWIV